MVDEAVWQRNYEVMQQAAAKGFNISDAAKYNSSEFKTQLDLTKDAGRFAAFKNAKEQGFLRGLSMSEQIKTSELFNKRWLKVEAQQATANARMAKKWLRFEDQADIYPNLMYSAVMDKRTRHTHAEMDGIVRAIDDAFWNTRYPPNGWGCRCTVVQTDDPVNEKGEAIDPDKGFDFNPGKDKKLFSSSASYYKTSDKAAIEQMANTLLGQVTRKKLLASWKAKTIRDSENRTMKLTKSEVEAITAQPNADELLRNALLSEMEAVMKEAKLVKESGKRLTYQVNGYKNMYLVVKELAESKYQLIEMSNGL